MFNLRYSKDLRAFFGAKLELFTNYVYVLLPGFEGTWEVLNIKLSVFNLTNTLIQLPFVSYLAWAVTKIVPGSVREMHFEPKYLEPRLLRNPSVALG